MKTKRAVVLRGDVAIVPLTRGYEAIVDAEFAERVAQWNWAAFVQRGGAYVYARRSSLRPSRRTFYLHREVAEWNGLFSAENDNADLEVDHINGNPLDNRLRNLRVCLHAENSKNRRRHRDNTSGAKGVHWNSRNRKWQALIQVDGQRIHLGCFNDPAEAAAAYEAAAELHFGAFKRAVENY